MSGNRISRIEGLDGLESLKRLILSNNEIEKVEGLETCDALETLQLQGNRVSNLDDMQCLSGLPCLRHVQMQVRGGGADDRNPMCDHPAYRSAMRRMLTTLQTLDGERVVLADVMMPKDASAVLAQLSFAEPEPWLKDFDWGDTDDTSASAARTAKESVGDLKSAQEFQQVLLECKRLSAKAGSLIEDYRAKTPR